MNARELQTCETANISAEHAVHRVDDITGRQPSGAAASCYCCGRKTRISAQCPFKEAKCLNCGKKGHIQSVCRSWPQEAAGSRRRRDQDPQARVKQMELQRADCSVSQPDMTYSRLRQGNRQEHWRCSWRWTGSACQWNWTLVSESTYRRLWPNRPLQECLMRLHTYSGEQLTVLGQLHVQVQSAWCSKC